MAMESLRGHLLVASRKLVDPNFRCTVVLIVQHGEDGALGVILNRPSNASIRDIWSKISDTPCECDECLSFGGPVPGPLMAVHTEEACSEVEVVPGVHFSVQRDNLNQLVTSRGTSLRLFFGHSGWAPGQLESEMEQGSWHTALATANHVFHAADDQWAAVMREIAQSVLFDPLQLGEVPDDPTVN
jgi:putative transcriptional regulator